MKPFQFKGFFVCIEVIPHSGALFFSGVGDDGEYIKKTYIGYTLRGAKANFKEYIKKVIQ